MKALGMSIRIDEIGNVTGVYPGATDLPPVMIGSHIDTVGTGGIYDGNYGVLSGLEVVETLKDAGTTPMRRLHEAGLYAAQIATYPREISKTLGGTKH